MIQTSYSTSPAAGVNGMLADSSDSEVVSGLSSSRKLLSVAFAATNSVAYTVTINSSVFTYTSDSSATLAEIAAGLLALIAAGSERVVASGAASPILIESTDDSPAGDFTYAMSGAGAPTATLLVAHGELIPYGVVVCMDERPSAASLGEQDVPVRLPRQATDITSGLHLGLVIQDPARSLGSYRASTMINVLEDGKAWATTESAVVRGGDVYVRFAAGSGGSQLGAIRGDSDSGTAALLPRARFCTTASAAAIAIVEVES